MKKALLNALSLALLLGSLSLTNKAFAIDPAIDAFSISPNPIQVSQPGTAIVAFSVGGTGTIPAGNVQVQVSFPTSYLPNPQNASAVVNSAGGALFSWTYNAGTRTLTGTSTGVLNPGDGGQITINIAGAVVTAGSTDNATANLLFPNGALSANNTGNDGLTAGTVVIAANPVTLASFNAVKEGQSAVLSWSTTEETNSERFDIEHSLNAKNWQKIGVVLSKGESEALERYLFTDTNPANGTNFYRLRMVDRDGTSAYTRAKSLEFDIKVETALYPNPVADRLLIKAQDMTKIKSVSLLNLQGKVVLESSIVPTNGLDVINLPTGLYVVQVVNVNGSVNSFKVMKN
ncbi:T9SS type A sorting domain-containing protein [Runella sp.]|uniref:T9SS type A sorting domain-containing protein n=1 Tax=Runella sp. TaxID=1960881 RepID=UPI003D0A3315